MEDTKNRTTKYYLLLILILGLLSGALWLSYTKLISVRDELADELGKLNVYAEEEKKVNQLLEEYSVVKEKSEKIHTVIPDRENIINVVEQIEAIGNTLDVSIGVTLEEEGFVDEDGIVVKRTATVASESLDNYSGISGVETLDATINMVGSIDKIVNLIGMLDDMTYYVRVNSIRIGTSEEGGSIPTADLSISIFVKPGGEVTQ